nr:amidohydrolase family protein [Coprococcus sp. AF21-14LB]
MKQKNFVLKGDICYSKTKQELITKENHFLVCEDGRITGVFPELPKAYGNLPFHDCSGHLVIPGLVDLHVHAPQYTFRGMGMDMELLDWLDTRTFPEETRYEDISYAEKAYRMFVGDLQRSATTRACIFATRHEEATVRLMELLEEAGVCAYVGKVCMDRNSPDPLRELDADTSANATKRWISACQEKGFSRVKPILTPRFIPTCTDELMEQLSEIQKQYQLPMQSHLSENIGEIAWVKELCPWSESYGEAYEHFGLFGKEVPTIMAHCVHLRRKSGKKC